MKGEFQEFLTPRAKRRVGKAKRKAEMEERLRKLRIEAEADWKKFLEWQAQRQAAASQPDLKIKFNKRRER
jgi:hypothetical protein